MLRVILIYSNTSHVIVYRNLVSLDVFVYPIQIHLMLLFIYKDVLPPEHRPAIQIHLMLLFIVYGVADCSSVRGFKYISCYCLSTFWHPLRRTLFTFKYISCYCLSRIPASSLSYGEIQNTSQVIFYPCTGDLFWNFKQFKYISCYCLSHPPAHGSGQGQIQIHLMLLFIVEFVRGFHSWHLIQIHLMLLFISGGTCRNENCRAFKYISCYCLSICQKFFRSLPINSNTSHVIVYLIGRNKSVHVTVFKYISCYCLSISTVFQNTVGVNSNTSHVIVYQPLRHTMWWHLSYSNTSHVIVYRGRSMNAALTISNSNTSHVIVYRINGRYERTKKQFKYISCYCLSSANYHSRPPLWWFKYISCYCLSWFGYQSTWIVSIQIHLMLLFIRILPSPLLCRHRIQIHLMLLFIPICRQIASTKPYSNTSHVIVYLVGQLHDQIEE